MINVLGTEVFKLSQDELDVVKHIKISGFKLDTFLWACKPIFYEFDKKTGVYRLRGDRHLIKQAKKELLDMIRDQYLPNKLFISLESYEIGIEELRLKLKAVNKTQQKRFAKV